MDGHAKELIRRLAMMLDGLDEILEKAAETEKRREAGKGLRNITMQRRAKAARELVDEAADFLKAHP